MVPCEARIVRLHKIRRISVQHGWRPLIVMFYVLITFFVFLAFMEAMDVNGVMEVLHFIDPQNDRPCY